MKNRSAVFLFLILSVFVFNQFSRADDFSAEINSRAAKGMTSGKVFASDKKVRVEMLDSVTITRMDKNVVWVLMPERKMYLELPASPQNMAIGVEPMPGEIGRRLIGTELIDGRMTGKYEVTYNETGHDQIVFIWIDPGLNLPVRMEAGDGSWAFDYKNIEKGVQDPSLFEIPADYQKISSELPK